MENVLLVSLLVAVVAIVGLIGIALRLKSHSKRLADAELHIHSLTENLNALCSGAVGVDQRVSTLERTGRDLAHRQDSIESQQQDHPYGEAIQLVQQGASASRLVEELGLSRSEADLVVMLHSSK